MLRLLQASRKTGVLEIRGPDTSASLEVTEGVLTSARVEDDAGEIALGAILAIRSGDFAFAPGPTHSRNLSGSLDALLERAQEQRARFEAVRQEIPDDRMRFALSSRATDRGSITISPEQWRVLLAVDGRRDVRAVAAECAFGRLTALGLLYDLVAGGLVDAREPAPEEPPPPPAREEPAPPSFRASAPAVTAPAPEPPASVAPAPPTPEDLAAALAQRLSAAPPASAPAPEAAPAKAGAAPGTEDFWTALAKQQAARAAPPEAPPEPPRASAPTVEAPPEEPEPAPSATDARLAALFGAPAAAPPVPPAASAPVVEAPPAAPQAEPEAPPVSQYLPPDVTVPVLEAEVPAPPKVEKPEGPFAFLRRSAAPATTAAPVAPVAGPASPVARFAAFANGLLAEYNSGQYGKGRLIERMQVRLRLVDEQAEPIDRPLPVSDERLDVATLARGEWPAEQALPYLAVLVRQIFEDARNVFGSDKAKKGYRAAIRNALGSDALLRDRAVAELLPKV